MVNVNGPLLLVSNNFLRLRSSHLEDLDDALLVVRHVDRLEHFTVLAATQLADDLVVVLLSVM